MQDKRQGERVRRCRHWPIVHGWRVGGAGPLSSADRSATAVHIFGVRSVRLQPGFSRTVRVRLKADTTARSYAPTRAANVSEMPPVSMKEVATCDRWREEVRRYGSDVTSALRDRHDPNWRWPKPDAAEAGGRTAAAHAAGCIFGPAYHDGRCVLGSGRASADGADAETAAILRRTTNICRYPWGI